MVRPKVGGAGKVISRAVRNRPERLWFSEVIGFLSGSPFVAFSIPPMYDWRCILMTPDPYIFIVIFVGVALVFPLIPLALAWLWRRFFQPPKPGAEKNAIYECGVESIGDAQIQFRSQYYLYAIIFLIFDVEAIFLVPFAVAFTGLPVGAFIAILVFLLLLIEGLVWAWGKGCLNWAR